jgi:hypothetical protein
MGADPVVRRVVGADATAFVRLHRIDENVSADVAPLLGSQRSVAALRWGQRGSGPRGAE